MSIDELYRETILEHSQNPRNKRPLPGATGDARGYNPLCGDDITVYVRVAGDRVAEATYTGRSCAICEASASMLTEAVAGQAIDEVERLIALVKDSLTGQAPPPDADGWLTGELGELEALQGVRRYPVRVKCATLSWNALQQALAATGSPNKPVVTTE
jgi:nitrogen fixation NifU-like protein